MTTGDSYTHGATEEEEGDRNTLLFIRSPFGRNSVGNLEVREQRSKAGEF